MKVLTVVGARPQFIKAFPVSRAIREDHDEVLVHTGQHYDDGLSAVFFRELELPTPDYNLGVGSGTHADQTGIIMQRLDDVIDGERPDVVVVFGDTNSTLAGALVAAKRSPALAHVEAGLRSGNRAMPEETNRVLTDHASDLLLAPSERAVENLKAEGITDGVVTTGDVMYDALRSVLPWCRKRSTILEETGVCEEKYILMTVHRAENTDDHRRLESIIEGLEQSSRPVVFACHPRTRASLKAARLWDRANRSLEVIAPVGYLDFVRLLAGAERVVTDSGGVQKEAFFLDTPCVTLRDETEWIETVRAGWNVLVGTDPDRVRRAISKPFDFREKPTPYGDGSAAVRVVTALKEHIHAASTPLTGSGA